MEDPRIKPARLDISELEKSVRTYFSKGLAPSTQRTYKSAQDWYLKFCTESATAPLPISESQLCSYVSFLANEGLKHRSIKSYLSAICHLQIAEELGDPFHGISMQREQGYSFRIGAATTAATRGIEDSVIRTLGRWESVAYLQYVCIPREQLFGVSSQLAVE